MNNELKKIADDYTNIQKKNKELSEKLDLKKKFLSDLTKKMTLRLLKEVDII